MNNKSTGPDIVNEVLESCILAFPTSSFIISLYKQYVQRGWLSKKQLESLHNKATKIPDLAVGKLATMEAMIKRMPNRYKSEKPLSTEAAPSQDLIDTETVLKAFPNHKGATELLAKLQGGATLLPTEKNNLKRFMALVEKMRNKH